MRSTPACSVRRSRDCFAGSPSRPGRTATSTSTSPTCPRTSTTQAPSGRRIRARGGVGIQGDPERRPDRPILQRPHRRGVRPGHLEDRPGRGLSDGHRHPGRRPGIPGGRRAGSPPRREPVMLVDIPHRTRRRILGGDPGRRRGDRHLRAVSRRAQRHDRRAGVSARRPLRGDRVGQQAGDGRVGARRAVLQLLLPAARLHASPSPIRRTGSRSPPFSSPPSRPASSRSGPNGARPRPRPAKRRRARTTGA